MVYPDDPVKGITGVRPVSGDRERSGQERRTTRSLSRKPGRDSVNISPRARRLADIENFLAEGEEGNDKNNLPKGGE